MPAQAVNIRPATQADLGAINDIYNHYVLRSTCTFQEVPETLADRVKWFEDHDGKHPVIVAELAGRVAGWGSLSTYHPRSAFRHTVENSVYVQHDFQRQGIGSQLLAELIVLAQKLGHRAIIAAIEGGQTGSLALHERHGFKKVGHFKEVGFKFGRWLDGVYLELLLDTPAAETKLANGR